MRVGPASDFANCGRWRRRLALATVVASLLVVGPMGCSDGAEAEDDGECAAGTRGCECDADGTCDDGLSCVDQTCTASSTDAGPTDGASDTSPDGSADGTADSSSDDRDGTADGGPDTSPQGGASNSATLGPSGGELSAGNAQLKVPEGALQTEKEITITQTTRSVPAGYDAYSSVYEFEPSGLEFEKPVELSVTFEGDAETAALFWSRPGDEDGFEQLLGTIAGGAVTAEVDHFSTGFVANGLGDPSSIVPTKVSAGYRFSCALLEGGEIRCWGDGAYGKLGNGQKGQDYKEMVPVAVKGILRATDISTGGDAYNREAHACAVLASGEVRCWGYASEGQLGNDSASDGTTPVAVRGISTATDVSAGYRHTCAVLNSGEVRCWGFGDKGQLGNGSTTSSSTPVAVEGISTATDVSAGYGHSCAVLESGRVKCWGWLRDGRLGNGRSRRTFQETTPVYVKNISSATEVVIGNAHTCATLAGVKVACWGAGEYGQLGNGRKDGSSIPVEVEVISGVTDIAAGGNHSCAALDSGEVYCWGRGLKGRLGNGSEMETATPVAAKGISTAIDVSGAYDHTCAVLENAEVMCWGNGAGVQLDGSSGSYFSTTPVKMTFQ